MKKLLFYSFIVMAFLFLDSHFCCAQYYSSSDWMSDKPYQDLMSGLGSSSYSTTSSSSSRSKSKSKKNRNRESSSSYDYDYSASIRRQAEIAQAEEMRRAAEAERARKEEEFRADKAELQGSLRGVDSDGGSFGYGAGLRGISDNNSYTAGHSGYSSGLRGLSDDSSPVGRKNYYGTGLRGYSDDDIQLPTTTTVASTNDNNSLKSNNGESRSFTREGDYDPHLRGMATSYSPASSEHREYLTASPSGFGHNGSRIRSSASEHTDYLSPSRGFQSTREYSEYLAVYNPEPIYYQGSDAAFFRKGTTDSDEESLLERIEQRIDIWREAGEHQVLTYIGDKLTGLARKTISSSSAMGTQVVKLYDTIREIAGVKNLEMNIANRSINAIKRTVSTGDARYVNEANKISKKDVDDYATSYFEKKGLIYPGPKALDKKGQEVTKELVETGAEKGIELWLIGHRE